MSAAKLADQVLGCRLCDDIFSHSPRPMLQINDLSRIIIASQAPGSVAHASGIPFEDASGNRLRDWMGVDKKVFYDDTKIAILPMAFCYPGKGKSGDLPPPSVCAETWRSGLMANLKDQRLMLIIGQYAQAWHLPDRQRTLTETVRNWADAPTHVLALPHPSPRNNIWLRKNPWFETEVLPELKRRVQIALSD